MTEDDGISIREYFETLCNARMHALHEQFEAKLDAMDRAIDKAEEAQRQYNVRSNEFRGQLDDQAKTLMPRSETGVLMRTVEGKLVSLETFLTSRIDHLAKEISTLREYRSRQSGEGAGREALWGSIAAVVALGISLVSVMIVLIRT